MQQLLTLTELPFHLKFNEFRNLISFNEVTNFIKFQTSLEVNDNYGLYWLNTIIRKDVITENYKIIKDLLLPEEFERLLNLTNEEILSISKQYNTFSDDVIKIIDKSSYGNYTSIFESQMKYFFIHEDTQLFDIYNEYGITLEHMIDKTYYAKNFLGNGYMGAAFKEGNRVCKITTDAYEYNKSKIIQKSDYNLRKYFCTIAGVIYLGLVNSGIYNYSKELFLINKEYVEGSKLMEGETLEHYFDSRILKKFDTLIEKELLKNGIREMDLHSGNVVIFPKDSDVPFKFFDF